MPDTRERTTRIFLIDDHPAVRDGLKLLFSGTAYKICGEAENGAGALAAIGPSGAGLAILDISLGDESGLALIAALCRQGVAVLIYSMHEDVDIIEKSFTQGAAGYVSKREKSVALRQAVADVLAGHRHLSPRVARCFADRALSPPPAEQGRALSEREKEILALLGRGEANADIAVALEISIRTVETHFVRIIAKLKLGGMKELRRHAILNKR